MNCPNCTCWMQCDHITAHTAQYSCPWCGTAVRIADEADPGPDEYQRKPINETPPIVLE